MSFKDLQLKRGYRSTRDDILNEFYIPVLSEAVSYDRIAGYFSSASLSVAARGIAGLIRNNGQMRLITSPELTDKDYELFKQHYLGDNPELDQIFLRHLDDLEDLLHQDHLRALCWLLEQGKLEIKVAIPKNADFTESSGLFHLKIGILRDQRGTTLSFSGSVNETASAWTKNREEFKVFLDSDRDTAAFCKIDVEQFDNFWNGIDDDIDIIDLPISVKKELVKRSPTNIDEVLDRIDGGAKAKPETNITPYERLGLFDNQEKAVHAWFDNDRRGIFAMATGTGKTRTAIGCILKCIEQRSVKLIVISAPQNTILLQWIKEIERLDPPDFTYLIADSSNPQWRSSIVNNFLILAMVKEAVLFIFTTHRTLSSQSFIEIIQSNGRISHTMLVCDEVHGIGARKSRKALIDQYKFRLGLSATPERWFDEIGSDVIFGYFDKIVYSFPIRQALIERNPLTGKPYLCRYNYYPIFVSLTDDELEQYHQLTKKIIMQMSNRNKEDTDLYELLLFKRANVYKKASQKLIALENLTDSTDIGNSIIFTCDRHMDAVKTILSQRGITFHSFTEDQGTTPQARFNFLSEREHIIEKFVEGLYSVLISIKCLDEGIDIPSADKAIVMTSGGNPREYIQRIGRVIRQHDSKKMAHIYDFIVKPRFKKLDPLYGEIEKKIFEKELDRAREIACTATNSISAVKQIYDIMEDNDENQYQDHR